MMECGAMGRMPSSTGTTIRTRGTIRMEPSQARPGSGAMGTVTLKLGTCTGTEAEAMEATVAEATEATEAMEATEATEATEAWEALTVATEALEPTEATEATEDT